MPRLRQRGKVGSPEPTKLSASDSPAAGSTAGSTALPGHIKKRLPRPVPAATAMTEAQDEHRPLLDGETAEGSEPTMAPSWAARNQWIVLALASGGCAAFNGVFAKLTTTELTTSLSQAIARFLGLSAIEGGIELVTRAVSSSFG
ncbi:transcription initiation factor iia small subunit [Podospora aff. communis PSN243]|uniref:Transcription initiation factor iia small subunit n=1 Tax=Podospora aff. communis PSN243 TaxID=3040156 RepID=A0AAV9GIP7_9PEZI|nr:transcription initiation factor iia small subunit [Podospora aff. communis PSN243]